MRTESTLLRPIAILFAVATAAPTLLACASDTDSKRRPAPPGGGVDPATIKSEDLSMGGTGETPPEGAGPTASPASGGPVATEGAGPAPSSAATGSAAAPTKVGAPPPGSFKITAEHCKELGRKFSQLTVDAGLPKAEAKTMSDDILNKCLREEVGTMQTKKEYDCFLALKRLADVESCKKK